MSALMSTLVNLSGVELKDFQRRAPNEINFPQFTVHFMRWQILVFCVLFLLVCGVFVQIEMDNG